MTAETLAVVHRRASHHDPDAARQAVKMFEEVERRELDRRDLTRARVFATGRLMLAAMFLVTGIDKLLNFSGESQLLLNFGLNDSEFAIFASMVIEIGGAVLLALGWKTRRVSIGLSVYLGLATLLALAFFPPAFSKLFLIANVGVVGGLFSLIANGAGSISLDAYRQNKEALASAR